jgi:hypothetical protein
LNSHNGQHGHSSSLQSDGAEKFARASPNNLHAETKQDKGGESNEDVSAYGAQQSRNSI